MTTTLKSVQGLAQLLLDLVSGVTIIVDKMHRNIAERANPLTQLMNFIDAERKVRQGTTYRIILAITDKLKSGVRLSAEELSHFEGLNNEAPLSNNLIAALNGVCGDHLQESGNPLAIAMQFHTHERPLTLARDSIIEAIPNPGQHIIVMVHGLCLSHECWHRSAAPSIGQRLQAESNTTCLYLNYNTGRHISDNGQELATQLSALMAQWPVEVRRLTLIGYSMGGLVIRSACHYAEQAQARWLEPLTSVIYIGAPHHGSALAKAANLATFAMTHTPFTEPLAIGQFLSAGIKDLSHGNLLEEDWANAASPDHGPDLRQPIPLTHHAEHYFVAAALGSKVTELKSMMLGDLLVRLGSATGQHQDELKRFDIKPENCRIVHESNHFDMLHDAVVVDQIADWLQLDSDRLSHAGPQNVDPAGH